MSKEQEKFFKVFVSESTDILSQVSDDLLELEKDPENKSVINALFRHLHTLKGNASLDGFEKITRVAHIMESIFDKARDGSLIITSDNVDVLFESLDLLEKLLEGLLNNEYEDIEAYEIETSLNDILSHSSGQTTMPPEKTIVGGVKLSSEKRQDLEKLIEPGIKTYLIDLTFNDEPAGALNTFIILNNLKATAKAIISSPPESELQSIKQLAKSQVLVLTDKPKEKLQEGIKNNCETSVIIEIGLDKIPSEEMELAKSKQEGFSLEKKDIPVLIDCINNGSAFALELNFSPQDAMKSINSFVIINNLKPDSSLLFCDPDSDEIQKGGDFSKVVVVICTNKKPDDIKNTVKLNCKDFTLTNLTKEKAGSYFDTDFKKLEEKNRKEIEKKQISEEISKNDENQRKTSSPSVSVEVEKFIVDGVIENIGELVLNMNFISSLMTDILEDEEAGVDTIRENLKLLNAQVQGTALMLNTLMDYAFVLRLVPLKPLFKKLPRIVRDSARKVNKKVRLEVYGQSIRVEQDVMNMLEGPIMHILRNSVDHGIETPEKRIENGKEETGIITVSASQEHRFVKIEICDDGGGINTDKVLEKALEKGLISKEEADKMSRNEVYNLLFHPGFSTKEQATELSGRGVGMDVVLHEMQEIGGTIEVESEPGKGSTFRLKFPANV